MVREILVCILLAMAATQLAIGAYAFTRRRQSPVALPFASLLLELALYAGGYAGELLSSGLSGMTAWSMVQYLGISFMPATWIILTARYLNFRWSTSVVFQGALLLVGSVTLFAAVTDPFLRLKYASVAVNATGSFPVLAFNRGPLYWWHVANSFLALGFSTVALLWNFIAAPKFFRKQQFFMLFGSVVPWINYAIYLLGVHSYGVDTVPFGLFVSIICFALSIFGFKILDIAPVARGLIFESMSDGAIVLDQSDRIVDFNANAAAIFPTLTAGSLAMRVTEALRGHRELCERVRTRDYAEFHCTVGEGEDLRHYLCKLSPIESRPKVPVGRLLLFKDNTASTVLVEKLQELATIDPLTRAYNRRYFLDLITRQLSWHARGGHSLAIVILDIDHFKRINDHYGHLMGDEVLKSIATTIAEQLRACDVSARFGGEEFICLLTQTSGPDAFAVAERIREAIRKTCTRIQNGNNVSVSVSLGVYSLPVVAGNENVDTMIGRADAALYRAKRSGRNRTVAYIPEMDPNAS